MQMRMWREETAAASVLVCASAKLPPSSNEPIITELGLLAECVVINRATGNEEAWDETDKKERNFSAVRVKGHATQMPPKPPALVLSLFETLVVTQSGPPAVPHNAPALLHGTLVGGKSAATSL
ncbi:unnamed protein product [Pleuronectes platessa]|uniref:Uncharacterized protein n=1 Tax=Pleuronectes platessa TaxID=8262 RepID=A0A9N7Z219_PLEPL|nr:unnamed protein product [Pleuronectes platessa]